MVFARRLLFLLMFAACGGSGAVATQLVTAPLLVAAGTVRLLPAANTSAAAGLDLARVGFDGIDVVYELTTPADAEFLFDLLTPAAASAGGARVSVAHIEDGGQVPAGGAASLAAAGLVPNAAGSRNRDPWLDALGDGFARISLRGRIDRDQMLAVEAVLDGAVTRALVCLRVGAVSPINTSAAGLPLYPDIEVDQTIYSSDSWRFGLPTTAVSGDRTSVVVYEGDRGDPFAPHRFELRLQHDAATGLVTAGGDRDTSADLGNWRDHEIAALFNVLALASGGAGDVVAQLSFDRGATFGQTERFAAGGDGIVRLVQIAMASDYALAIAYWVVAQSGAELRLVRGTPINFDVSGPTGYTFPAPQLLFRTAGAATPVVTGAAFSSGGDLVIGYGYSSFESLTDGTFRSTTEFRCATLLFGATDVRDTQVEFDETIGRDPSVALLGAGANLRIFFAYEGRDGIRLRTSEDAGTTFGPAKVAGDGSAHLPSVFARTTPGGVRVDLLYLTAAGPGNELHLRRYDDFDGAPGVDYRLTEASVTETDPNPTGRVPGAPPGILPPQGLRITQVAWFGYDAQLDGDEIVVVVDEETYDAGMICIGLPAFFAADDASFRPGAAEGFAPAEPPPLAPGLTEPAPAPLPDNMHQLRLLRLR